MMIYAADSLNSFPIPIIAPDIRRDGTKSVFTMETSTLPLNPGYYPQVTCNLRITSHKCWTTIRLSIEAKITEDFCPETANVTGHIPRSGAPFPPRTSLFEIAVLFHWSRSQVLQCGCLHFICYLLTCYNSISFDLSQAHHSSHPNYPSLNGI
jgi:hypothetical protein